MAISDTSISQVIYTAVKPIFKIYCIIGVGFFLGRRNVLTVETCKKVSNLVVKLLLPCLMFNKIVSNITNADINQIGIICLVSIVLYGIGAIFSCVIFFTTKVPKSWFGGCISVGLFPNVAELPIAYLTTMVSIFTDEEIEKGQSYIIIFLSVYFLIQFNLGAIMLIELDYKDIEKVEKDEQVELQRITSHASNLELRKKAHPQDLKNVTEDYNPSELNYKKILKQAFISRFSLLGFVKYFIENCKRPISITMIVAITISMIPWVQTLFVVTPQYSFPNAPDGNPPLSWVIDFTNYLSQPCVPFGILILGATLSRLPLKEDLKRTNATTGTIWLPPLCLAITRLCILPIIGILIMSGLKRRIHWLGDDTILMFVCCISFGLPCATSLIYLCAAFSNGKDIQMKYLSMVYIFQYSILAVSLPFLTTYTIKNMLD